MRDLGQKGINLLKQNISNYMKKCVWHPTLKGFTHSFTLIFKYLHDSLFIENSVNILNAVQFRLNFWQQ